MIGLGSHKKWYWHFPFTVLQSKTGLLFHHSLNKQMYKCFLRRTQTNNATVRKVKKRKDTFLRAVSARSIPVLLPSLVQNSNLFFPFELFCVLSLFSLCKSPTCFLSSVCSLTLLTLLTCPLPQLSTTVKGKRQSQHQESMCVPG